MSCRFEQNNSLTLIVKEVTRFSNHNSCIDLIFTNSNYIANSGTLDVNLRNHKKIFLTRKQLKSQNTPTTFSGRSYLNFDVHNFENMLLELDWNDFNNIDNVNDSWNLLKNNILTVADTLCPLKTFKIKKL